MSKSFDKGRDFESEIAKLINHKLRSKLHRDSKSGGGNIKQDIRDWYNATNLSIEAKHQKTIKINEWFKQSATAASVGQIATVVFKTNEEILVCLRFDDLLNLIKEIEDQKKEIEILRKPITVIDKADLEEVSLMPDGTFELGYVPQKSHIECRGGHLSDQWGYCQILDCKYSRGYRPKKTKRA